MGVILLPFSGTDYVLEVKNVFYRIRALVIGFVFLLSKYGHFPYKIF